MKSSALLALCAAAFVSVSSAFEIGAPANGSIVNRDQDYVVQVIQESPTSDPAYTGIRIGLFHGTTLPPLELGTILFDGPYNPVKHEAGKPPYENYTVQIPLNFTPGDALLSVAPNLELHVSPLVDVTSVEVYVNPLISLPPQ